MHRKNVVYATIFIFSLFIPCLSQAGTAGIVNVKKLNVRVRPTTQYSITGILNKGDKVNILKREGDWYMISAPKNSAVWLSRPFITGNTISKRVNLRCGPSVAFMKYTAVNAGLKVTVVDDSRDDWIQILPPRGLATYVSAKFITITAPTNQPVVVKKARLIVVKKPLPIKNLKVTPPKSVAKKVLAQKTVAEVQRKPKKIVKKSKIAKKFEDMSLEELLNYNKKSQSQKTVSSKKPGVKFVKQIEKSVTFQGILLPLATKTPVATHCIAIKIHDEYVKTCFIYTDRYNLSLWENRKVSVKGVQRWVKGWVIPVIEAERIRPVWN